MLEGELADLGDAAPVYRLVGPKVDEPLARRLADALDMKDAKITANPDGLQAQTTEATLTLNGYGGLASLFYSHGGGTARAGSTLGSSSSGSSGSDSGIVPPDATQNGGGGAACPPANASPAAPTEDVPAMGARCRRPCPPSRPTSPSRKRPFPRPATTPRR